MKENIKDFLTYGISQEISKKQIINMDILMIILGVIGCIIESQFIVINLFLLLATIAVIIITFHTTTVKGKNIFKMYGMWSVFLSIFFGILGTKIALSVLDKEAYVVYILIIIIVYLIVVATYINIIIYLIKTNSYKKLKKINGTLGIFFSGIAGIAIAKIFLSGMSYRNVLEITSICCYLISMLSIIGIFNLIKYWGVKYFLGI